jgi:hypothetical protein
MGRMCAWVRARGRLMPVRSHLLSVLLALPPSPTMVLYTIAREVDGFGFGPGRFVERGFFDVVESELT